MGDASDDAANAATIFGVIVNSLDTIVLGGIVLVVLAVVVQAADDIPGVSLDMGDAIGESLGLAGTILGGLLDVVVGSFTSDQQSGPDPDTGFGEGDLWSGEFFDGPIRGLP